MLPDRENEKSIGFCDIFNDNNIKKIIIIIGTKKLFNLFNIFIPFLIINRQINKIIKNMANLMEIMSKFIEFTIPAIIADEKTIDIIKFKNKIIFEF